MAYEDDPRYLEQYLQERKAFLDLGTQVSRVPWFEKRRKLPQRFLNFSEERELPSQLFSWERCRELGAQIMEEFKISSQGYSLEPGRSLVYAAYKIEGRKQFLEFLKSIRKELHDVRPRGKRQRKEKRWRHKQIDRIIEAHDAGTKIFPFSRDSYFTAREKYGQKGIASCIDWGVPTYVTELGVQYDAVIDFLEKQGVPNTNILREYPKQAQKEFRKNWRRTEFGTLASAYLLSHKEEALEEILHRVPCEKNPGSCSRQPQPKLRSLFETPEMKNEIERLGLPEEPVREFFSSWGENFGRSFYENHGLPLIQHIHPFYRKQLATNKNPLLRWTAALALITRQKHKKTWKKHFPDLPLLIEHLDLETQYPELCKKTEVLERQLLEKKIYYLRSMDEYDLTSLEALCATEEHAKHVLAEFGFKYSVQQYVAKDNLNGKVKNVNKTIELLLQPEFQEMKDNEFFRKFFVKNFRTSFPRSMERPYGNIYAETLHLIRKAAVALTEYKETTLDERAEENIAFMMEEVRFDVPALETMQLYQTVFKKPFENYVDDFIILGNTIGDISTIHKKLKIFPEERLRPVMNYITKKRSKDLINTLSKIKDEQGLLFKYLSPQTGKADFVKTLVDAHKTKVLLEATRNNSFIHDELANLEKPIDAESLQQRFRNARDRCYRGLLGEQVNVPAELQEKIDNVLFAYLRFKDDELYGERSQYRDALRMIATTTVEHGSEHAFARINALEKNRSALEVIAQAGVNTDAFVNGITQTYTVQTKGRLQEHKQEKIAEEFSVIYDRLDRIGLGKHLRRLAKLTTQKRLENIQGLLRDETEPSEPFAQEIYGHLNAIRSIQGLGKNTANEKEITFYVSQDPIESLHMGQYFKTCLSLVEHHGGMNAWASVVQTMNAHMNVIYARDEHGNYVARNRSVLTPDGIFLTRFYKNGSFSLDEQWSAYLKKWGQKVGVPVYAPVHATNGKLDTQIREVSSLIPHGHFERFYGDGLYTEEKTAEGVAIHTNAYVF